MADAHNLGMGRSSSEVGVSSLGREDGEAGRAGQELKAMFKEPRKNEGLGMFGCSHYRRRCHIRAPCCGELFPCRHCHNSIQGEKADAEQHDVPRHQVERVVCCLCQTEQEVQQFCISCGVCMGQYFCDICKFYDDDTSKKQFHCSDCGICRVGGRDKFFHCQNCGCCYGLNLKDKHRCVDKAMNHNCPICFEYLFDSLQQTAVLEKCGHTLHSSCLQQLQTQNHLIFVSCPICSRSIGDLTHTWKLMDDELEATPMPREYEGKEVPIVCNDCGGSSSAQFHVVGLKCKGCGSYNTRQ